MRALVFVILLGCGASVDEPIGFGEPLRVVGGSFEAELPARGDGGVPVTSVDTASGILVVGQQGRVLSGRVGKDAYALALRFEDLGTGWWIAPVGDIDPVVPADRSFNLSYDIGAAVPTGLRRLQLAAVDERGAIGTPFALEVCVIDDRLPDELNVCDATLPPPAAIISLTWDRNADLDLRVRTPSGKFVGWKRPSTASAMGQPIPDDVLDDPTVGRFTRDSNAECRTDGRNAEAVVWAELPGDGPYTAYVDMFEACGAREALYSVAVYRRVTRDDGTYSLKQVDERSGTLLDLVADGGAETALFVLETDLD
jgi:hypothetical protein